MKIIKIALIIFILFFPIDYIFGNSNDMINGEAKVYYKMTSFANGGKLHTEVIANYQSSKIVKHTDLISLQSLDNGKTWELYNKWNCNTILKKLNSGDIISYDGGARWEKYQNDNSLEIEVYPNPANNIINVNLKGDNKINTIEMTDLIGNSVRNYSTDVNNFQIIATDLASGVYYLTVYTDYGKITKSIIIQN